jgi:hypothetical protein
VLLAEFITVLTPPKHRPTVKQPRFSVWGKRYWKAVSDWVIAAQCETNRRLYGMTHAEARDEASCCFRGTSLAGSPDTIGKRWKAARRRAREGWFQRTPTKWESRTMFPSLERGEKRFSDWWAVNNERVGDRRGEWHQRPRKLAMLKPSELEREAEAARMRARKGGDKKHGK